MFYNGKTLEKYNCKLNLFTYCFFDSRLLTLYKSSAKISNIIAIDAKIVCRIENICGTVSDKDIC